VKGRKAQAKRNSRAHYKVYGRPPIATRFTAGRSGNPKGRPKGSRNAETTARDALERTIAVGRKGTQRKKTVREIAYERLGEKALAGDIKALNFLLSLEDDERERGSDRLDAHTSREAALQIIQAFLDRQRRTEGKQP
jgi:hypothetical protein